MKFLLDTHALHWYVEGSPRLSETARTLMQDMENQIFVSPASYWEMAIKVSLGKWKLNRSYAELMDLAFSTYGFQILGILPAHTTELIGLPFHHGDPFDRLLIAQALSEKLSLLSADGQLDAYGISRVW